MRFFRRLLVVAILLATAIQVISQDFKQAELSKLDARLWAVAAPYIPNFKSFGESAIAPSIQSIIQSSRGEGFAQDFFGLVVYTDDPGELRQSGFQVFSEYPGFVTVRVTAEELTRLARIASVRFITPGSVASPLNDAGGALSGASLVQQGFIGDMPITGSGVVLGVIDTGIDFTHPDFRDPANPAHSRILYLWDRGLVAEGAESPPVEACCQYGVEYTQAHLNDELDGTPAGFVRSKDTNGHGTHVTGTAGGNGAASNGVFTGYAPGVEFVIVKHPGSEFSADLIDAVRYLQERAALLGRPLVVNHSFGGVLGPADALAPENQAITGLVENGVPFVQAAGNSGDDMVHAFRSIPGGQSRTVTIRIDEYTAKEGRDNDIMKTEMHFRKGVDITVRLTSPTGAFIWRRLSGAQRFDSDDGSLYLNFDEDAYNPALAFVDCSIWDNVATAPPRSGDWIIEITNHEPTQEDFHLWVHAGFHLTKYTSFPDGDNNQSVALSAGAEGAVVVGNTKQRGRWMSAFDGAQETSDPENPEGNISAPSSRGPVWSGEMKPDLVAPGRATVSALSKDQLISIDGTLPGSKYEVKSGTSMAAPAVTGSIALMLEANPTLTPAEISDILKETADRDEFTGPDPGNTFGYGKLDALEAVVKAINRSASAERRIEDYGAWGEIAAHFVGNTGFQSVAHRFSPPISGIATGLFYHTGETVNLTAPLSVRFYPTLEKSATEKALGREILIDPTRINAYTWNYVSLLDAGIPLEVGSDYYVVIQPTASDDVLTLQFDTIPLEERTSVRQGDSWGYISGNLRAKLEVTKLTGIGEINLPPIAQDDEHMLDEDTSDLIPVLANDLDGNGDALQIADVTVPAHGSASIEGNAIRYVPHENFFGDDQFAYYVQDGHGGVDEGQVTLIITSVNDDPVASLDLVETPEDTPVEINVLENDTDVENDPLGILGVTQPDHGFAELLFDPERIRYVPEAHFFGLDTFTYHVSDDQGGSSTGEVRITVIGVNNNPIVTDDVVLAFEDTPVMLDLLANDSDPDMDALIISDVTQAQHGLVEIVPASGFALKRTGGPTDQDDRLVTQNLTTVRYTPNKDYHGPDGFQYTVSDQNGGIETGDVSITVAPINDPPIAVLDEAVTEINQPVDIDVLGNDSDVDGDQLVIAQFFQPFNGAAERLPDNRTIRYTPRTEFTGQDSFSYEVSDGAGGSDIGTVNIRVSFTNRDPVAEADFAETDEDVAVSIPILLNDSDADGHSVTVSGITQPQFGSSYLTANSTLARYVPADNYFGTDRFSYTINDGYGGTANAMVTVVIRPVNDAPTRSMIVSPESGALFVLEGDGATQVGVSWSQSTDIEDDPLTYTWELSPEETFLSPWLAVNADAETSLLLTFESLYTLLSLNGVDAGNTAAVWHRVVVNDGTESVAGPGRVIQFTLGTITATETVTGIPEHFALVGNYPNPFNPSTTIVYNLPVHANVSVTVVDTRGRAVMETDLGRVGPGYHRTARLDLPTLPSGLYLYRVRMDDGSSVREVSREMVLLK